MFYLEIGFLLFLRNTSKFSTEHNGGQSIRDTLNTAKPNLADKPSLANAGIRVEWLERWTFFGQFSSEQIWLAYHYTKLGRSSQWTPTLPEQIWLVPLHKTWQMNLLWLNTMAKVRKLQHSLFLRYPTAFSQNTFLLRKWLSFIPRAPETSTSKFQGCWTQWQRFESSSIQCFWDSPQHFSKHIFA